MSSEELMSAMLDGECSPAEMDRVLREIEASPALKARWSRMCLARDALADIRVRSAAPDFCSGVMAAIARDEAPQVSSKVVPLRQRAAARAAAAPVQARAQRWQPMAGLAAAASIAAVAAVGGYRWLNQPVEGANAIAAVTPSAASAAPAMAIQPASFGGSTQARLVPVSASSASGEPVETNWAQLDAETARQLNEFVMEHSSMRAQQGMGGALSYPRMVRTVDFRSGGEPH
jgi:negative regulator of sigma E activity